MHNELLAMFYPMTAHEKDYERMVREGHAPVDITSDEHNKKASEFLQDGKLIAVRPHWRYCAVGMHRHDYIEMAYVLNGSVTQLVEEKEITLVAGDLLIMNRNVRHAVRAPGKEDIMVNFIILPAFFDSAVDQAGIEDSPMRRFFVNCVCGADDTPAYLHFSVGGILPVTNLLENMIWSMRNDVPYKQSTNQQTMSLLLRLLPYHADCLRTDEEHYDIVWRVQRYIEDHYRDGNLEDAARNLNCNYRRLSNIVREKTGKSFTELIQERRIQQALYLLSHTNYSIEKICGQVGYVNISYFYRIFRQVCGMTPRQIRLSGAPARIDDKKDNF